MKQILKGLTLNQKRISIVEIGAGMPISDALLQLDGASAVMNKAYSPYSKEHQGLTGANEYTRSVSFEGVKRIAQYCSPAEIENTHSIVVSCQAGPDKAAHGYMRIARDITIAFSAPYGSTKKTMGRISKHVFEYCIERWIIGKEHDEVQAIYGGCFITGVFNSIGKFLPMFMPLNHAPFVYMEDNNWARLSSKLRPGIKYDTVSIVKGTFNPIHAGHEQLFAAVVTSNKFYSMTANTVEGKSNNLSIMISRAQKINGNCIIDSGCKTYLELLETINMACGSTNKRVYSLPMGEDVFRKVDTTTFKRINVSFLVYPRTPMRQSAKNVKVTYVNDYTCANISSTEIRFNEVKAKMFNNDSNK